MTGFDFGTLFTVTLPNISGNVTQWFEDQRRGLEEYLHDTFGYEHDHVADATQDVEQSKAEADAFIRNLERAEGNAAATRQVINSSGMEGKGLDEYVDFKTGRLKKPISDIREHVDETYEQNRTDAIASANATAVAEQATAEQRLSNAGKAVDSALSQYQQKMTEVSDTVKNTFDVLTGDNGYFSSKNSADLFGLGDVDPNDMDQIADATSRMVNTLSNYATNPMNFADALGLDYSDAEDAATKVNALIETINQYDEAKKKLQDATKEQENAEKQVEENKKKQEQYTEALDKSGAAGQENAGKLTDGFGKVKDSTDAAGESVGTLKDLIEALKNKTITITTIFRTIGGGGGYNPNSIGAKKVGSYVKPDPTVYDEKNSSIGFTAKGQPTVPYDDYLTRLHRGEMVLTKSQARKYREGINGSIDLAGLAASIVAAVKEGMAGASVNSYLDGRSVTGRVNRRNTNRDKARRFVTA